MENNIRRYARTDLALELKEDVEDFARPGGISLNTRLLGGGDITETVIRVTDKNGEKKLGKPIGTYVTLESRHLRESDENIHEPFSRALNDCLRQMIGKAMKILVVGLGNRAVTPDALGPYVVDNLYITRHLISEGIVKNVRELSAICPGVMAQTGIETGDILRAVCDRTKPDVVIAVDALAAREPSRLNSTIQICDTGISPGAGVGNNRGRLDEKTLGVKVIAIGVPTVISVPAIINQAVDGMIAALTGKDAYGECFTDDEKYALACELASPYLASMFVTPKNIDEAVKRVSYTISEAINGFF